MRINKLILFLAAAGMIFTSCEKEDLTTSSSEEVLDMSS
ncbi:hypothetical protein GIHI108528_04855 [Gillisia hiemivivida]